MGLGQKFMNRMGYYSSDQVRMSRKTEMLALRKVKYTDPTYASLAEEGYKWNVYLMAGVRMISMAASVPWLMYAKTAGKDGDIIMDELGEHPVLTAFNRPNPYQGRTEFLEFCIGYLLLSGNCYILPISAGKTTRNAKYELYALRPDRVTINKDSAGNIVNYQYINAGGVTSTYTRDQIIHIKCFNPLDDYLGHPWTATAARSVDQNNSAKDWNVALLQNSGRPSGALVSEESLSEDQYNDLKGEINEIYTGEENAGRPLLLQAGLDWREMSLNPLEMNWLEGVRMSGREIAVALGVPPELLGDSQTKTYNNVQEARKALYMETVLPLLDKFRDAYNGWMQVNKVGDTLYLDYDIDSIDALQKDRKVLWTYTVQAYQGGVLTLNEAREALQYEAVSDGDKFFEATTAASMTGGRAATTSTGAAARRKPKKYSYTTWSQKFAVVSPH